MSGLEIVALVPAILSAYCAASSEYKAWRTRKKKRAKEAQNAALQTSLDNSGTIIQSQYKLDVQHLGHVFEKGDGKCGISNKERRVLTFVSEIGCGALKDQLIILQNSVIALLVNTKKSDTLVNLVHPSHDILWSKSNSVRGNIITALAEQYQRIQQSKPIQQSLPAPSTPASKVSQISVAVVPQTPEPRKNLNCRGIIKCYSGCYSCELCSWKTSERDKSKSYGKSVQNLENFTVDGKMVDWFDLARIFHHDGHWGWGWRCDLCDHHPDFYDPGEIINHCKYFHKLAEILDKEDVTAMEEEMKVKEGGKFKALRLGVRRIMLI